MKTDLSGYRARYRPASKWKIAVWIIANAIFFSHKLAIGSAWKCKILRIFGARIGRGVVIKPSINIKYPWLLVVGDHCWIGEGAWIDNLAKVTLENNVCLSQGAYLLTGNHDYTKPSFDLMTGEIKLESGVWIGAKAIVCPGVTCSSHAVLAAGSVATKDLEAYGIYQGNPAIKVKNRVIAG